MSSNQEIYPFAEKWFDLFHNIKTTPYEVKDPSFGHACFALGFKMDCSAAFEKAYPGCRALSDYRALDQIVDGLTEVDLLGSAIFSQWWHFTHWASSEEDILSFENRSWFIIALGRLKRLTSGSEARCYPFSGNAKKLQIVSNRICYGPCPQPEDEVEQYLSLTEDGRVCFSSYIYANGDKYIKSRSRNFEIGTAKASYILNRAGNYFSNKYDAPVVTDVGAWKMTLTNADNTDYSFQGSLCPNCDYALNHLSDLIRSSLEMPELFVFDGCSNTDRIERIAIDYHRVIKRKPGVLPEGVAGEYAIGDYSEQLTIDRKTETLEHLRNFGSDCQLSQKCHAKDGIASLLDSFDVEALFSHTEGNPPDVLRNPLETTHYRIIIDLLYGEQRVLTGSFDKNGLPDDFSDFAETVFDFTDFYGTGQMLDPSVYDKALRKRSDLIFCNVQFEEYGKTYCYLTDDDTLVAQENVVVPVGKNNYESIAKIESIVYRPAEEAPFPMDKIKKILRRAETAQSRDDPDAFPEGAGKTSEGR